MDNQERPKTEHNIQRTYQGRSKDENQVDREKNIRRQVIKHAGRRPTIRQVKVNVLIQTKGEVTGPVDRLWPDNNTGQYSDRKTD
jgi:hypothetical protein